MNTNGPNLPKPNSDIYVGKNCQTDKLDTQLLKLYKNYGIFLSNLCSFTLYYIAYSIHNSIQ